jgi:hypothetical protein
LHENWKAESKRKEQKQVKKVRGKKRKVEKSVKWRTRLQGGEVRVRGVVGEEVSALLNLVLHLRLEVRLELIALHMRQWQKETRPN